VNAIRTHQLCTLYLVVTKTETHFNMKLLSTFYSGVATVVFTLALAFFLIYGILNFTVEGLGKTSAYRIEQYPNNDGITTYIWAKRYDDNDIIYSMGDKVTADNVDSVANAHRVAAEKLIKGFKKLK